MRFTLPSLKMPSIIQTIAQDGLEGLLICRLSSTASLQLFFRKGQLVHIAGERPNQEPDSLLHELFGALSFEMEWQAWQVRLAQSNVGNETRAAFLDVLRLLTSKNNFEPADPSQVDPSFFGKSVSLPNLARSSRANTAPFIVSHAYEPEPIDLSALKARAAQFMQASHISVSTPEFKTPAKAVPSSLSATSNQKVAPPVYFLEKNLLLPPGIRQSQLEDLLGEVSLREQLETLNKARFTGCVYYKIADDAHADQPGDFGLVLFVAGKLSDILHVSGRNGAKHTGNAAHKLLEALRLTPEIYRVELRVVLAYRAIVATEALRQTVKATRNNFTNLISMVKQSGQDGVIILHLDTLKQYYFLLFEGGSQVGVFGPESGTGHLQLLASPLALPAMDSQATMTVMLAPRLAHNPAPQRPAANVLPPIEAEAVNRDSGLPNGIAWNNPAKLQFSFDEPLPVAIPQPEPQLKPGRQDDTLNPFDF